MGTVPKPDPWKCHSRLRHKIVTLEVLRSLLENAVVKVTWLLPLSTVTAPGITNIFFFFMSQVQTPKNRIWLDQLLVTAQWNEPGWERFTCHSALKSTDCLQVRCPIRCRRGSSYNIPNKDTSKGDYGPILCSESTQDICYKSFDPAGIIFTLPCDRLECERTQRTELVRSGALKV